MSGFNSCVTNYELQWLALIMVYATDGYSLRRCIYKIRNSVTFIQSFSTSLRCSRLFTAPVNLELRPDGYPNHVFSCASNTDVIDRDSDCYFRSLSENIGAGLYAASREEESIMPVKILKVGRAGIPRASGAVNVTSLELRKHP
jgi:hypothetical protein